MNVFIIGSGTFGTAIANELARNKNNKVVIFSRSKEKKDEINHFHTNKKYFPDKILNDSLVSTNEYSDIQNADIIFLALPSSAIIENIKYFSNYITSQQFVVNLSKGILSNGQTIIEYLTKELKSNNLISLKGPSFAVEIMNRAETVLTLGYSKEKQKEIIFEIFSSTCIHLESTKDINGVEILGVIKNIYAILLGIVFEKFTSPNSQFMILSKVFNEIKILNNIFKGDTKTIFLACGLGDICLTSFNELSRNRTLGKQIAKGLYKSSENNMNVIEGVNSLKIIFSLIDVSTLKELPLLNKLFLFFDSELDEFNIDLKELFN